MDHATSAPSPAGDPAPTSVEGAAFGPALRGIATLLVVSIAAWAVKASDSMRSIEWPWPVLVTMSVALALVIVGYYWILVSRTAVDASRIRQSWLWDKEVALADIIEAKFIYLPRLTWLVAPRLIVRTRSQGMLVFHAASPAVQSQFALLSLGPLRER